MRLLALVVVLIAPAADAALVKYEYTGAKYDYYADPVTDPTAEYNPYLGVEQDFMTGWLVLDTDLLPSGSNKSVSVQHYIDYDYEGCGTYAGPCVRVIPDHYFFDGVFEQSPRAEYPSFRAPGKVFEFTTDANGDLTSWHIFMMDDEVWDQYITSDRGDTRYFPPCGDALLVQNICVKSSKPGTWRQVPVSEPATLGMLAFGVIAAMRLRRTFTVGRK